MQLIRNLIDYKELLITNVKKDIRGRYRGSFLGMCWSFLNPLLQVLVYALVFPYLFGNTGDHYVVYLITGIIPWTFFSNTLNGGTAIFKQNAGILKKVYFPREILPISTVLSGLIDYLISCVIIVVFCLCDHVGVSWTILFLPLVALVEAFLILGLVFILSSINVYIPDTGYIVQFVLNLLFYGTPIIYNIKNINNGTLLYKLISINPMTVIVNAIRDIFLYHQIPNISLILVVLLIGVILTMIGYFIFKRLQRNFAEEL